MAWPASAATGPASARRRYFPMAVAGSAAARPWRCGSRPAGRRGPVRRRWQGIEATWRVGCSEFGRSGGPGIGNGVADVGQAADVDQQALEAEAEAGVRYRAITAQVAVPAIGCGVEAELDHAAVEVVQPLLA